jgi:trimeric autotransporter adhesin
MAVSTIDSSSLNATSDLVINGLTVGKGGGSVSTNTAVGASALAGNSSGAQSTALGYQALQTLTNGTYNTAVGYQALNTTSTNNHNTAVGKTALAACVGDQNTAVGSNSLRVSTSGASNVGVGYGSLTSNTTGSYNIGIGDSALQANTTASNSTAVGYQALYSNTATQNTAIGSQALYSNTAVNNVAIGYQAGYGNTSGAGNIFIGQGAGYSTYQATTGSFNILIGATAQNSATGNGNEIVIGTNNPTGKGSSTGYINSNGGGIYQGNNSSSWSTTSDFRLKKNIVDNTEGLDKISQIRVRNFEYRLPEEVTELDPTCAVQRTGVQLGVIAQELREVCPDCVKEESTGVLSVDPDNLTWHMLNAIKDLKTIVDAQAAEIAELKAKVA